MDDDDSSRVSPLKKMLSAFPAAPGNLHQIAPTMKTQAKRVFQTAGRRRGVSSNGPFHDKMALMKKRCSHDLFGAGQVQILKPAIFPQLSKPKPCHEGVGELRLRRSYSHNLVSSKGAQGQR